MKIAVKTCILSVALILFGSPGYSQAPAKTKQSASKGREPGQLIDQLSKANPVAQPDDSLPPDAVKHLLLDKSKIARETHQRLEGLRQAGNPHIRRGLKLDTLQEDPKRSRVDLEKLREQRIRMIEQRGVSGTPVEVSAATTVVLANRAAKAKTSRPRRRKSNEASNQNGVNWLFVSFAATAMIVLLLWHKR